MMKMTILWDWKLWKKIYFHVQEIRTFQLDESLDENDEMDMSDDDNYGSCSSKRARIEKPKKKVRNLKVQKSSAKLLKSKLSKVSLGHQNR